VTLLQPIDQHRTLVTTPGGVASCIDTGGPGRSGPGRAATPKDQRGQRAASGGRTEAEGGMVIKGWHGWIGTFNGVALITVAALPLAALAVWALARRHSVTGTTPAWAWRKSLAEVGIVYGTVPWVWMIMLPGDQAGAVPARVSLVPLRDLLTILAGDPVTATVQVAGNLLVLAALGFLAPLRFTALASVPRILALAAGCSVLVETAQYVLRLDRGCRL
jgi:VanZ like protein